MRVINPHAFIISIVTVQTLLEFSELIWVPHFPQWPVDGCRFRHISLLKVRLFIHKPYCMIDNRMIEYCMIDYDMIDYDMINYFIIDYNVMIDYRMIEN